MSFDLAVYCLRAIGRNPSLNLSDPGFRAGVCDRTASHTGDFATRLRDAFDARTNRRIDPDPEAPWPLRRTNDQGEDRSDG